MSSCRRPSRIRIGQKGAYSSLYSKGLKPMRSARCGETRQKTDYRQTLRPTALFSNLSLLLSSLKTLSLRAVVVQRVYIAPATLC